VQAGVVLPSPRFTDNGDGTITDNLTGEVWLKDASCATLGQAGQADWATALTNVAALADEDCGLSDGSSAGDWYLPNVRQLQSLIHYGFWSPALSDAAGTAKWVPGDAFIDVPSSGYWSSTTDAQATSNAWIVRFTDGLVEPENKANLRFVLPVRGGS
jgi:hypothetical protein